MIDITKQETIEQLIEHLTENDFKQTGRNSYDNIEGLYTQIEQNKDTDDYVNCAIFIMSEKRKPQDSDPNMLYFEINPVFYNKKTHEITSRSEFRKERGIHD